MLSTKQIIARNSLFGAAGQIALKMLSVAFTIVVVRQLGDHDYGVYATVGAFVGITAVFSDMGMAGYAVRDIATDHSRAPVLFTNMVVVRLILSIVLLLVNVGLGLIVGYTPALVALIALGSIGLVLYAVQGPLEVILLGFERVDYTATFSVLSQLVFIIAGGLLLWWGFGVPGVMVASFCGIVATAIASWRAVRSLTTLTWGIDVRLWPSLLWAGLPFCLSTFAMMVSFKVDTVLLSLWRTPAEVGWYNVAYNLIFALYSLLWGFNATLVPSLSRHSSHDPSGATRLFLRAVRFMWLAVLPIAVGTALLADRIIIFFYGVAYAPAGPALRALIWVLPVLTLTSLCGVMSTVLHRERATARVNAINATVNIALNLWAIPHYGIIGAAIVTVITEFCGLLQLAWLLRDTAPLRETARTLWAPLLATLALGATTLLLWRLPLPLLVPLAAVSYGAVLVFSGGVSIGEVRSLGSVVTIRLARYRRSPAD